MIKEFELLVNKMEVQINFEKHPEGIKAKIIFIPLVKDLPLKQLVPISVWGKAEEVENSIRYNLEMMDIAIDPMQREEMEIEIKDEVKPPPPELPVEVPVTEVAESPKEKIMASLNDPKIVEEIEAIEDNAMNIGGVEARPVIKEPIAPIVEVPDLFADIPTPTSVIKEKIIEKTGIPANNIIVASPIPLPDPPKDLPRAEDIILPQEVKRCSSCELPKGSVGAHECIYPECPDGKYKGLSMTPQEAYEHSQLMAAEDRLIESVPVPVMTPPSSLRTAFNNVPDGDLYAKDPAADYIDEQLESNNEFLTPDSFF